MKRALAIANCLKLIVFSTLLFSLKASAQDGMACYGSRSPCLWTRNNAPAMFLMRPFTHLRERAERDAMTAARSVQAFWPVFAFGDVDSDNDGESDWRRVGVIPTRSDGYAQIGDLIPWRQRLVMAYVRRGVRDSRMPMLGFETLEQLIAVTEHTNRQAQATALSDPAARKRHGVIVSEPDRFGDAAAFIDINELGNFYLMPIIDWEKNPIRANELYLKVISELPEQSQDQGRSEPVTVVNPRQPEIPELKIDVVFAMDTTLSMKNYIAATLEVIQNLAFGLQLEAGAERVRFGFVGYRDSPRHIPGIDYASRNYTPRLLSEQAFGEMLSRDVRATSVDSTDFSEDVYAGLATAIEDTAWTPGALRIVILVGDASAHEPMDEHSSTRHNAASIASLAESNNARILSMHVLTPQNEIKNDRPIARMQFRTLSAPGPNQRPYYFELDASRRSGAEVYSEAARTLLQTLIMEIMEPAPLFSEPTSAPNNFIRVPATSISAPEDIRALGRRLIGDALIDFYGDALSAPRDVTFWTTDRALNDPRDPALEVRVLISHSELDDLNDRLRAVSEGLFLGRTGADPTRYEFFDALRELAINASIPGARAIEDDLAEANFFPEWLSDLPYRSDILTMTDNRIQQLSSQQYEQLEADLKADLEYLSAIYANLDLWVKLDERSELVDAVYAIPLEHMP